MHKDYCAPTHCKSFMCATLVTTLTKPYGHRDTQEERIAMHTLQWQVQTHAHQYNSEHKTMHIISMVRF